MHEQVTGDDQQEGGRGARPPYVARSRAVVEVKDSESENGEGSAGGDKPTGWYGPAVKALHAGVNQGHTGEEGNRGSDGGKRSPCGIATQGNEQVAQCEGGASQDPQAGAGTIFVRRVLRVHRDDLQRAGQAKAKRQGAKVEVHCARGTGVVAAVILRMLNRGAYSRFRSSCRGCESWDKHRSKGNPAAYNCGGSHRSSGLLAVSRPEDSPQRRLSIEPLHMGRMVASEASRRFRLSHEQTWIERRLDVERAGPVARFALHALETLDVSNCASARFIVAGDMATDAVEIVSFEGRLERFEGACVLGGFPYFPGPHMACLAFLDTDIARGSRSGGAWKTITKALAVSVVDALV